MPANNNSNNKVLVVCDVQPDVIQKLPQARKFLDLVEVAVRAARRSSLSSSTAAAGNCTIIHTLLQFDRPGGYSEIPRTHPRLGVLRRLGEKNPNVRWFTSGELSISVPASLPSSLVAAKHEADANGKDGSRRGETEEERRSEEEDVAEEIPVPRTTYLPHSHQTRLMDVLRKHCCCIGDSGDSNNPLAGSGGGSVSISVLGYGPTVQAMCSILGDVLAAPNVQILRECVSDEKPDRLRSFLEHGTLFDERVVSLVDFLEETDLLHERVVGPELDAGTTTTQQQQQQQQQQPPPNKYVTDCDRGGHLCLYKPHLVHAYGFTEWPAQPWYQTQTSAVTSRQYLCPLGRRLVDLCDEPQFGSGVRFFLRGREHLDEKDRLGRLVPELMPRTFDSIEEARVYAKAEALKEEKERRRQQSSKEGGGGEAAAAESNDDLLWFVKAVNQNGGRAVRVTRGDLSDEPPLGVDEQIQVHVPRPLLYYGDSNHGGGGKGGVKFHVKTYQHISYGIGGGGSPNWRVYVHDLFYLCTATEPWSPHDLSDEAQITTMRTRRLYPEDDFRQKWNLTDLVRDKMRTLMERAVGRGKLVPPPPPSPSDGGAKSTDSSTATATATTTKGRAQFEVHSADWMLDRTGRIYLIECNGTPVLYDPSSPKKQRLVTKGLRLYDELYRKDPANAVVDDSDLVREALGLALTGTLPEGSLWRHLVTIPAVPEEGTVAAEVG